MSRALDRGQQPIAPSALGSGTPDGTTFLRGDGVWEAVPLGSTPGQLQLLQEDIFTTSGTWTKASGFDPDDTVMIFLVGGGASGAATYVTTNNGAAGGGGGCVRQNATAVSGAGSPGALIVRYYRGRVSPLQVISYGA